MADTTRENCTKCFRFTHVRNLFIYLFIYYYYNLEGLIEFLFVEDGRGVAANIWSQAVQSSAHIKYYSLHPKTTLHEKVMSSKHIY